MGILSRIWDRVSLFFRVDLPMWFSGLSLIRKILLLIPVVILAPFLYYLVLGLSAIPIFLFLCWINNDKTYEFLRPANEIAHVEIIQVTEDIWLYSHPLSQIPELLAQSSVPSVDLAEEQHATFWSDFREVQCNAWWNDPSPDISDGTILILYSDGSQEWICADGTFYYDAASSTSGMTNYYFDDEEFSAFLEKYGYPPA